MTSFRLEYLELMGNWIRGNHAIILINEVRICGNVNLIKIEGMDIIFSEINKETKKEVCRCRVDFSNIEKIEIYIIPNNDGHYLENLQYLKILPTPSNHLIKKY